MTAIKTLDQLKTLFRKFGVQVIYLKELSKKQDNTKNQIYLGTSLDRVSNLVPMKIGERGLSSSTKKTKSDTKARILEGLIDFSWIGRDEQLHHAPDTGIIFYHQFPEVRFSGFMQNCDNPLDSLRKENQAKYGKRLFLFGQTDQGKVVGLVLTQLEDPVVLGFPEFEKLAHIPILQVISAREANGKTPWDLLRGELEDIFDAGWHFSQSLKRGASRPEPFNAPQASGYTLEAILGVFRNSDKASDKHGYEIKALTKNATSLMTPTPDLGFQGRNTFKEFIEKYGRPSKTDPTKLNFNGTHKYGIPNEKTGFILDIHGYSLDGGFLVDPVRVSIVLLDPDKKEVVAGWSLVKFLQHWNKKHESAVYVPAERRDCTSNIKYKWEYRYGRTVYKCNGVGIERLLNAIIKREVVYDPGDTNKSGKQGKPKNRPQWRASNIKRAMSMLYKKVEVVAL
jgi:hypothetical protein